MLQYSSGLFYIGLQSLLLILPNLSLKTSIVASISYKLAFIFSGFSFAFSRQASVASWQKYIILTLVTTSMDYALTVLLLSEITIAHI
jgi:hypothetical protein